MAKHLDVGKKGEDLAAAYLLEKGFKLLERNWRYSRAEVDLIALDEGILVFVEVKTRSYTAFGRPEEFVTERKEQFLAAAASAYMEAIDHDGEIRFDVIGVVLSEPVDIQHFPDAFFPGLV